MSAILQTQAEWTEANREYLLSALQRVTASLERHAANPEHGQEQAPAGERLAGIEDQLARPQAPAWFMSEPPALDRVSAAFGLSPFERDILVLCAGVELDARVAPLCAAAQGNPRRPYPTFSLALAALDGGHWSAIPPEAPLRRWHLIEVLEGETLLTSPLRVDERILHLLVGISQLDGRLRAPLHTLPDHGGLPGSYAQTVERVVQALSARSDEKPPLIQLVGAEEGAKRLLAAAVGTGVGSSVYHLRASDLPAAAPERDRLGWLWDREVRLTACSLYLDLSDEEGDSARTALDFAEEREGVVFAAVREPLVTRERGALRFDVGKPTPEEQREEWRSQLGARPSPWPEWTERVVEQFDLGLTTIRQICTDLRGEDDRRLWDACREHTRPQLASLAQRVEPAATWHDLVLPEPQLRTLWAVASHVRHRATVYRNWGFARQGGAGLGITALFGGGSGTGKSLAAEVLAHDLRLDLFRVDLSATVSKYIGETEKNLRRIFDAAEEGGAVLLINEADALFGKRTEIRDSHDRYANIEVAYLLQRMEAYRGLAILTTNLKAALDPAFLRRIRFVVQFPFPDLAQRAEIWRRIFPPEVPTDGLDPAKLAQLSVSGGNIRNIALGAAFLAAEAGEPVRMAHVLEAAEMEYAKLERPLSPVETGGWR